MPALHPFPLTLLALQTCHMPARHPIPLTILKLTRPRLTKACLPLRQPSVDSRMTGRPAAHGSAFLAMLCIPASHTTRAC